MKIHVLNIQKNDITTIEADTEALVELELRYKFGDMLEKVPVGDLGKCLDKINTVSYLSVKREP